MHHADFCLRGDSFCLVLLLLKGLIIMLGFQVVSLGFCLATD